VNVDYFSYKLSADISCCKGSRLLNCLNTVEKQCTLQLRLSIIVCTYNRRDLLEQCLESLVAQTMSQELFEIIVVDNNSNDGTAERVRAWQERLPFIHYLLETEQGLSHARNAGLRQARAEFIVYIDDDSVALPRWCEKILDAFMSVEPCPVVVGGEIVPRLERPSPWWFSLRLEKRSWGGTAGFLTSPSAHFGFSGSNMAFSRKILENFGGFNPDFGMKGDRVWLGEEVELFMRIYKSLPLFWYDPEIRVRHYVADSQMRFRDRMHRAMVAGRTRRLLDRQKITLVMVIGDLSGLFKLAKSKLMDRPFSPMYVFVILSQRIFDRFGYYTGETSVSKSHTL